MTPQYPHLCAPLTLGNATFRNRMFSAPMGGTDITNDGASAPNQQPFMSCAQKAVQGW